MGGSAGQRARRHSLTEPPLRSPQTAAARFSRCGCYRWWLRRQWEPRQPGLLFIGLNPSRADADHDDPTLRRLLGFADRWGFGSLDVVNLFSAVTPSPRQLARLPDPIGYATDAWIARCAESAAVRAIWLGWGQRGGLLQRDRWVLGLLNRIGRGDDLRVLGVTAAGQPRHPLYVRADQPWQPWGAAAL